MRTPTPIDRLLCQTDHALRILASRAIAGRATPAIMPDVDLSAAQSRDAAGLMRINHVGEICAQALYQGQALVSNNPTNRAMLLDAANEEIDHLAWTEQRLTELNSRPSLFNPLWYAGAFALGVVAGRVSEAASLGFVVETELQVGAHLSSHLDGESALPIEDERSRAIVTQMRDEELAHAEHARAAGAVELPNLVKQVMAGMAKVMTTVAYKI